MKPASGFKRGSLGLIIQRSIQFTSNLNAWFFSVTLGQFFSFLKKSSIKCCAYNIANQIPEKNHPLG